jgi:hypothetical protein
MCLLAVVTHAGLLRSDSPLLLACCHVSFSSHTTTALLLQGVHSLSASLPEPRDVRPSATAVAGGDDGWLLALGARTTTSASLSGQGGPDGVGGALFGSALDPDMLSPPALVNVNNRLVPESTVLNDGDLVILARERVKI